MAKAKTKEAGEVEEFKALVEEVISPAPVAETDTASEWITLRELLARMLAEFRHPDLAKRQTRDALINGLYPYRYLDGNSVQHHNDLPDDFLREADFDFETCSATRPARPYPIDELGAALANFPDDVGSRILILMRFVIIGVDCAYREAYCIDVQVPIEATPPLPTPPESVSVLLPTGMPGKPNLVSFVEEEAKRRLAAGEVWLKLEPFAESLRLWWEEKRKTYPEGVQRPLAKGTIENKVRNLPCWRDRKTKA